MTELIRIIGAEYEDQHGITHECYNILETVQLEPTGEYHTYEYYTETVKNPIYVEVGGSRRWRCMVPTDFGCPASWHRRDENDERVADEKWVRNREGGPYQYVGKPVVTLDG